MPHRVRLAPGATLKEHGSAELRPERWYKRSSWLPLALLAGMYWEASRAEAWGAVAVVAALGPVVLAVSTLMAAGGVLLLIRARRRGGMRRGRLVATILASSPLLLFLVRMPWMEFTHGLPVTR